MIVAFALTAILAAGIALAVRAARRSRRQENRRLEELARVGGLDLAHDRRWVTVIRAAKGEAEADISRWERRRILRAIDLAERLPGRTPTQALGAVAAFLTAPLRPLAGRFDLKRHGAATVPRLVGPEFAALDRVGLARLDVSVPARVYQTEDGSFVTGDQLDKVGIDAAALDGVALAVLRQRTNFEPVGRALDGEVVEWWEEDGCASSRILLLPERLSPGEELHAWVADADRFTISNRPLEPTDAERNAATLGLAVRIDPDGLRFD